MGHTCHSYVRTYVRVPSTSTYRYTVYAYHTALVIMFQHDLSVHVKYGITRQFKMDWKEHHELKKIHEYRTELCTAAHNGDVDRVSSILARKPDGTDLNNISSGTFKFDHHASPPLLAACKTGRLEVVKLLLKRKDIKINVVYMRKTPLSAAAENGYVKVMELLIQNGALVDYVRDPADSPNHLPADSALHQAALNDQYEAAVLLIERGASVHNVTPRRYSPLMAAATRGNTRLVKLLLDFGANTHSSDPESHLSPLTLACKGGHTECARLLIQHGADVNDGNDDGTPLTFAIEKDHKECVKLLLENRADVNKVIREGKTPLMIASQCGDIDNVQLLIDYGADVNISSSPTGGDTALSLACDRNDAQLAELLIKNGADVNHVKSDVSILWNVINQSRYHQESSNIAILLIQNGANVTDPHSTPLMQAVQQDNVRITEELVTHGATVDVHVMSTVFRTFRMNRNYSVLEVLLNHAAQAIIQDEVVSTFLVEAVRDGDYKLAKLLLSYKPNIDIVHNNTTALIEAAYHGREDCLQLLLDHSAQVNLQNSNEDTALIVVSQRCHTKCVECLLGRKDIDVNLCNRSGNSALMVAVQNGYSETAKLLLDHGAQPNLTNSNGDTALMMASRSGCTKCVEQLLLHEDIGVNLQNNKECTALMLASEKGHVTIIEHLLEHDAKLEILDIRGCPALFHAVKSNSPDVVELFLGRGADVTRRTIDDKTIFQFLFECQKEPHERVIQMLKEAQAKAIDEKPTLPDALLVLLSLASEWHNIGTLLRIPEGDLDAIGKDHQKVGDCLREMIKKWLTNVNPHPTWSSLAEAVELFDPNKAEEIRQKNCSNQVGPDNERHQPGVDQDSVEDQEDEAERNDTTKNAHSLEDSEDESNAENIEDPSDEQHFTAVEKAMREKGTLKHTLSHGVMVGPARSGKSSLMSRLAGEMPSFTSPSTGVAEKVVQVVGVRKSHSIALSVHDTIWFKLLYDQEAIRLMKLTIQTIPSQPQQPASTVSSPPTSMQSELEDISPIVYTHEPLSTTPKSVISPYPEGYIPPMEVFKGAIQGKGLESLRQHFENSWSFYLTDTGGQVEFQELLPLLVCGPSVFFFTFRLDQELNQRFTIEYHLPDGGRSKPYQSTLTVVEAILQTLASVASMGTFTYKRPQVKSAASLKPKMFIVGTHKDKLDSATADSEIQEIDQHLQKVIKSTSHVQEDIVQFATESQLIYTVNNFSEDDSDFKKIRSGVERVVCHSRFKVPLPTHWLIFSLVLRQEMIKDSIISYEQCFSIAKDCGITEHEELNHALWFLHTKIGLIRHFPTPGLNDFVIRDPQIVFDMVSKLIVNTFTFENAGMWCSTEFEKKGVFTLEDFLTLQQESPPLLPQRSCYRY